MSTSTLGFNDLFMARLEQLLEERHPTLILEAPMSGSVVYQPLPDFVVSNPRTGTRLALEVKSGRMARHIPFGLLPQLRRLRENLRSKYTRQSDVVLITTGEVPTFVRDGLSRDGIPILHVQSPEEAAERFGERLNAL